MLKKSFITIVFLGNTLLFSQTGVVTGKIIDGNDREELPFANIKLSKNGNAVANAIADMEGNFSFNSLAPGTYEMRTAYVGYQSSDITEIIVSADKTTRQNVEMEQSAIMICDIIIYEYADPLIEHSICCRAGCIRYCCYDLYSRGHSDSSSSEEKTEPVDVACKIYPNPFLDYAILEITSDMDFKWAEVQLFDLSGKKVREIDFSGKQVVIESEGLSAGTYLYQVNSKSKSIATGTIVMQ